MKMTTKWQQALKFTATTEKGYQIEMDGNGGAPSPMELMLASVGGCSSIDVVLILQKKRQKISHCRCEIEAERADAVPAVFTKIHARYFVKGEDISETALARACELSIEKYCSAALMLNKSVDISYSYEIEQDQ